MIVTFHLKVAGTLRDHYTRVMTSLTREFFTAEDAEIAEEKKTKFPYILRVLCG